MSNEIKLERVQSTILRELNIILQREFPDTDFMNNLTIHEVRLTNDMSHAKVYYSFMDIDASKEDVQAEINEYVKDVRHSLAGKVEMKAVPELEFVFDDSLENANRIEKILEEIK